MIPSVTFLFGCWVGCMVGLFLAGALVASRDPAEADNSSFPVRARQRKLTLVDDSDVQALL